MSTESVAGRESAGAAATRQDLARVTLSVISLLVLLIAALWILRPFFGALVWATMLVVSTWPLMVAMEKRFGGRRAPAVAVMSVTMLLLLIVPLWAAIGTLINSAEQAAAAAQRITEAGLPQFPAWLAGLPLFGAQLKAAWAQAAATDPDTLAPTIAPYVGEATRWIIGKLGSVGGMVVQFLLVVILSAILYAKGEDAAIAVRRFFRRLAGTRGEDAVLLAGRAIRGVALGVGVTAIVQTVLGSLGLLLAGIPFVALLSAVMLLLCIAQAGPALVLFPAVGWMYWQGDAAWATVLLVWSIVVTVLDNVLRPVLIRKGADLPLLLIFAGVIGGLVGFGLIGIFVGPVVLAVGYTLLTAWIDDGLRPTEPAGQDAGRA